MKASCDEQYMTLALEQARAALAAGEFPVGCVLVAGGQPLASGLRRQSRALNELDHAEMIALHSLYQKYPECNLAEVTAYSTMEPCLMCYATLVVNGVQRVVYAYEDIMGGGTNLRLQNLAPLYAQKKIEIVSGVLRREAATLFQQFFSRPDCDYLRGTLLAEYTLQLDL